MARTKAERARMDDLEKRLREAKALRWTVPIETDIPIPNSTSFGETSGYSVVGSERYMRVEMAWSSSTTHGFGYPNREAQRMSGSSGRQNGIPLFSSKVLALQSMRHMLEKDFARRLAEIDAEIEDELHKGAP